MLKNQISTLYNAKVDAILKKTCKTIEQMVLIARKIVKKNIADYILTNKYLLKGDGKEHSKRR